MMRTRHRKILLLVFLLTSCGIIQILPPHSNDDGSKTNGNIVYQFSESHIAGRQLNSTAGDIKLEEINYSQLGLINQKYRYTWLILWAPWCGHCGENIKEALKIIKASKKEIKLVLISSNYDIKNVQKELFETGYQDQAYVLNAKDYGTVESDKILTFRNKILEKDTLFSKMLYPTALPQNFLFSAAKVSMYKVGRINSDSLDYYFQ